jgi:hypothetical protein
MGHIRIGILPKTRQWQQVFAALNHAVERPAEVATATAGAAEERFEKLKGDPALTYCFWTLAQIATAARSDDFRARLQEIGVRGDAITSGVSFVQQVAQAVEKGLRQRGPPTVFSRIAELSLREALASSVTERSRSLFGASFEQVQAACREVSTEKNFGRAARDFFGTFMSRVVRYVADQALASQVGPDKPIRTPAEATGFQQALDRYCAESARVVEDFAGGWFSKANWETKNNISEGDAEGFTAYALDKIAMELRGESR